MLERLKDSIRNWVGPDLTTYSYEDLAVATDNFHIDHRIGVGAAGSVYRGVLRGGTDVAIKVLKSKGDGFSFDKELKALSSIRHPNIVSLLGYGESQGWKYIVCELLKGGCVARRLWRCRNAKQSLSWHERVRVARDASCGLSYMVNSEPRVFHRDIKPSNILLDEHGIAKLSDFGLVEIALYESKLVVDDISGTPGYICPVYYETGEVSESSEVFSFGVVLLELLVNKDAATLGHDGAIVYPLHDALQYMHSDPYKRSDRVLANLDLQAKWPCAIAERVSQLALVCVGEPAQRPTFLQIVQTLRHIATNSLLGLDGSPDASDLRREHYGCRTIIPEDLTGTSTIPSSFVAGLSSSGGFHTLLSHESTISDTTSLKGQASIGESIAQSLGVAWSSVVSLQNHFGWLDPDSREQLPEPITFETREKKLLAARASSAVLRAELERVPATLKVDLDRRSLMI